MSHESSHSMDSLNVCGRTEKKKGGEEECKHKKDKKYLVICQMKILVIISH